MRVLKHIDAIELEHRGKVKDRVRDPSRHTDFALISTAAKARAHGVNWVEDPAEGD